MCEHDAVFNIDVDEFVRTAASTRVDYVGFPLTADRYWSETCDGVYPESQALHKRLNCISLHSRRSIEFLLDTISSTTIALKGPFTLGAACCGAPD